MRILAGICFILFIGFLVARETPSDPSPSSISEAAPQSPVRNQRMLDVEMSLTANTSNPHTISGATNMPDGTILMIDLLADQPCAPDCFGQVETTVQNGHFTISPESIGGKVIEGAYTIEVITPAAAKQPENVQEVIGRSGEYLDGPYVVTFSSQGYARRSANPSDFEKSAGYQIRYVQKINATRNAPPGPYWYRIDADNGAAYAIDLHSIYRGNGTADAEICPIENNLCNVGNRQQWTFFCSQNSFRTLTDEGPTLPTYLPPYSLGRRLLDIACRQ